MAAASWLPSYTATASIIPKNLTPKTFISFPSVTRKVSCRASSCSNAPITDFDLYDLLGIDSSSDKSEIKIAYRNLQKRCHPDIAGPAGHDMAIILNQAYTVLSDPNSRSAYDKEQSKIAELRGYTGKPIYSQWFGSESEQRAVFVDEVKCVGCLKCALFADKTFAIESIFGRARVVAQWADPDYKIQAAIDACPVDCISMVERSDLAALEFLMLRQPRGNVRVGASQTGGVRVSNIFVDVKKFQTRYSDATNKANTRSSKYQEIDSQREARMSAIQAIRSISNWLYWQAPKAGASTSQYLQNVPRIAEKSTASNINKLREAAAARKIGKQNRRHKTPSSNSSFEYWIPSAGALPASTNKSSAATTSYSSYSKQKKHPKNEENYRKEEIQSDPIQEIIPMIMGIIAAVGIGFQAKEGTVGGLNEHFGGSLALEIVNSPLMQVTLAGLTWYIFGVTIIQIVKAFYRKV